MMATRITRITRRPQLTLLHPIRFYAALLCTLCAATCIFSGCSPTTPPDPNAIYHVALVDTFARYTSSPLGKFDVQQLKTKKYLFIYFAARWSDKYRNFTPKLIGFYNDVCQNGDNDIGIIFVPLDRTQYDANTFMRDTAMPWLCVRVHTPGAIELRKRYEAPKVPNLVLLDENDKVISSSYEAPNKYLTARPIAAYEKLKNPPKKNKSKKSITTKASKPSTSSN